MGGDLHELNCRKWGGVGGKSMGGVGGNNKVKGRNEEGGVAVTRQSGKRK